MYQGGHGLTRNIQVAVEYFRLAADQLDGSSLLMYGLALLKVNIFLLIKSICLSKPSLQGQGVPKNITEAVRLLEKAARLGYPDAQIALGISLIHFLLK